MPYRVAVVLFGVYHHFKDNYDLYNGIVCLLICC